MRRSIWTDPFTVDRHRPAWPPRPAGHPSSALARRYELDDSTTSTDDQRSR